VFLNTPNVSPNSSNIRVTCSKYAHLHADIFSQSITSLIHCSVNNALIKSTPDSISRSFRWFSTRLSLSSVRAARRSVCSLRINSYQFCVDINIVCLFNTEHLFNDILSVVFEMQVCDCTLKKTERTTLSYEILLLWPKW